MSEHFWYREEVTCRSDCSDWATGWTVRVSNSWKHKAIFLFSISANGCGDLSLRVQRKGPEADHSSQTTMEANNVWRFTSTPPLHAFVASIGTASIWYRGLVRHNSR
jgi:hypothetical protein